MIGAQPHVEGNLPARETLWPTLLGVVALVLAGSGALSSAVGMGIAIFGMTPDAHGRSDSGAISAIDTLFHPFMLVSSGVHMAISVLLAAGGVGLVRRRTWCVPTLVTWACLRLGASAVIGAWMFWLQRRIGASLNLGDLDRAIPLALALVNSLVAMSMPLFVLVWFRLGFVRREVGAWNRAKPVLATTRETDAALMS